MNVLFNLIVVVQVVSALAIIGLVLVQHGKGADMGASFGSGSSGSLFGATGSANFLSRSTSACATVFFVCTLGLAYFGTPRQAPTGGSSVLERAVPADAGASAAIPSAPASPSAAPSAATSTAPTAPAAKPGEIPKQ